MLPRIVLVLPGLAPGLAGRRDRVGPPERLTGISVERVDMRAGAICRPRTSIVRKQSITTGVGKLGDEHSFLATFPSDPNSVPQDSIVARHVANWCCSQPQRSLLRQGRAATAQSSGDTSSLLYCRIERRPEIAS
jgi:hypothetical protein